MTGPQLTTESNEFQGMKGLQKGAGAFFEVSEEAVRRLNSSASLNSCSGFPNDHPSESTSTTTIATSTDSVTNFTVTVSKETKKQLQKQERDAALTFVLQQQLERQIAFYFSPSNLETDTYLRTLMGLNDGCVPVRALANFGKVKGILWATPPLTRKYLEEEARMEIIVQAIQQSETSILQVEEIDASTGKILLQGDERLARNTIEGIRVKPSIDHDDCAFAGMSHLSGRFFETFTNTILLRDVHPNVTEEQVYHLLLNEVATCPPVVSVHRDVANCWFIELECDSKQTMMTVVMQLRSLTLAGEYIHARLKSSTLHQAPSLDPVAVVIAKQVAGRRRKKRGPRRNKKKLLDHKEMKTPAHLRLFNGAYERRQETSNPPPTLGEDEFPGLSDGTSGSMLQNEDVSVLADQQNDSSHPFRVALLRQALSSTERKPAKDVAAVGGGDPRAIHADVRITACMQAQRKSFADAARASSLTH